MDINELQASIIEGIPTVLPPKKEYDPSVNHAPKRKEILSADEKKLALKNALRYFKPQFHEELIEDFKDELNQFGRIYMHRFRPDEEIKARPISEYPGKCDQAKAIIIKRVGIAIINLFVINLIIFMRIIYIMYKLYSKLYNSISKFKLS